MVYGVVDGSGMFPRKWDSISWPMFTHGQGITSNNCQSLLMSTKCTSRNITMGHLAQCEQGRKKPTQVWTRLGRGLQIQIKDAERVLIPSKPGAYQP